MKKKYHYEIVLNDGETIHEPLVYKYRSTSNIELHISFDKARIIFEQSVFHEPEEFLNSTDNLRTDAVKKVLLLHLLKYGSPLDIVRVNIMINGENHLIFERKTNDAPLIYSMVEGKLDHPLPENWQDANIFQMILNTPKSSYDGRMNALIALLIGKSKRYYCEKAIYFWMSMNGFYNYLTERIKDAYLEKYTKKIENLKTDKQKQCFFCHAMQLSQTQRDVKKENAELALKKALALLSHLEMKPEELYEKLKAGEETEYAEKKAAFLEEEFNAEADPMTFLVMWLPYQIRCNYFHANQAMPLFLYADEQLLKVLEYTNYFVERFVEEKLPTWLNEKELSEDKKAELCDIYRALT